MNNSRILLILFAIAFLAIQIISYMGGIAKHEEKMVKLEKQLVEFETKGAYIDLKSDPAVKLKEEKTSFRAETLSFIVKVLVILGATAFVYALIRRERKHRGG